MGPYRIKLWRHIDKMADGKVALVLTAISHKWHIDKIADGKVADGGHSSDEAETHLGSAHGKGTGYKPHDGKGGSKPSPGKMLAGTFQAGSQLYVL